MTAKRATRYAVRHRDRSPSFASLGGWLFRPRRWACPLNGPGPCRPWIGIVAGFRWVPSIQQSHGGPCSCVHGQKLTRTAGAGSRSLWTGTPGSSSSSMCPATSTSNCGEGLSQVWVSDPRGGRTMQEPGRVDSCDPRRRRRRHPPSSDRGPVVGPHMAATTRSPWWDWFGSSSATDREHARASRTLAARSLRVIARKPTSRRPGPSVYVGPESDTSAGGEVRGVLPRPCVPLRLPCPAPSAQDLAVADDEELAGDDHPGGDALKGARWPWRRKSASLRRAQRVAAVWRDLGGSHDNEPARTAAVPRSSFGFRLVRGVPWWRAHAATLRTV